MTKEEINELERQILKIVISKDGFKVERLLVLFKKTLAPQKKEILEKVEKIKQTVSETQGTHKYDSCYDDIIELLK